MLSAPQKQRMMFVGEAPCPFLDRGFEFEHFLRLQRKLPQCLKVCGFLLRAQTSAQLGKHQGQQEQGCQLGGKSLGRGHADFRAGPGQELELAGPGQRRLGHVADGQRMAVPQFDGMLQSRQGVGCFSGLGDSHDQRIRVGNSVAVAVFAGDFYIGGNAGDGFQPIAGNTPGMIAGTAGQDGDGLDVGQYGFGFRAKQCGRERRSHDSGLQRVRERARLLVDFLLHVMAIVAQLRHVRGQFGNMHRAGDLFALAVINVGMQKSQISDVAVFQIDQPLSHWQQRRGIRGNEMFFDPQTDDERAALARADKLMR